MNHSKLKPVYLIALFACLFFPIQSWAGGYTVKAKVESIKLNKNWSYTAEITILGKTGEDGTATPDSTRIVHFFHTSEPHEISRRQFDSAIAILMRHRSRGEIFDLGIMGSQGGMKEIKGKAGEYKSINLDIHEGIVYTYGG